MIKLARPAVPVLPEDEPYLKRIAGGFTYEHFVEYSAIYEFDAGIDRKNANENAIQDIFMDFINHKHFKEVKKDVVKNPGLDENPFQVGILSKTQGTYDLLFGKAGSTTPPESGLLPDQQKV